jgi:hypothetical protein
MKLHAQGSMNWLHMYCYGSTSRTCVRQRKQAAFHMLTYKDVSDCVCMYVCVRVCVSDFLERTTHYQLRDFHCKVEVGRLRNFSFTLYNFLYYLKFQQ